MATNGVIQSFKENAIWILLTAFFTLIPFYFNTKSSIDYINKDIDIVNSKVYQNETTIHDINGSQLVQQEKLKNIEDRLERIEKKLDYLIENDQ